MRAQELAFWNGSLARTAVSYEHRDGCGQLSDGTTVCVRVRTVEERPLDYRRVVSSAIKQCLQIVPVVGRLCS